MLPIIPRQNFPYEIPLIGEVEKLFMTYGFVRTASGHRFFFHFGTCISKPEGLKVGDVVEFVLGEDVKTHRVHAQQVRKIQRQQDHATTRPPAPVAAILSSLPPASIFLSTQTLLAITTAGMIPVNAASAPAKMALANMSVQNSPCTSSPPNLAVKSTPPCNIPSANETQWKMMMENCIKRTPLQQIPPNKQQEYVQERERYEDDGASWDGVLFKPFTGGSPSNKWDESGSSDMAIAFERARDAWYSVGKY